MQQLAPQMNESDLPILQQLLIDDALPSWESESLRDLAIQTLQRIDTAECRELLDAEVLRQSERRMRSSSAMRESINPIAFASSRPCMRMMPGTTNGSMPDNTGGRRSCAALTGVMFSSFCFRRFGGIALLPTRA